MKSTLKVLATFVFAIFTLTSLQIVSSSDAAAKKCGELNQKACPKFFPGPQCKKGLRKVGKICRLDRPNVGRPPERPKPFRCGGLNQIACPKILPGPQCKKGLRKVGKYCRPGLRPPVRPDPRKCGTLNKRACKGNRCATPLVSVRGVCRLRAVRPIPGQPGNSQGSTDSVSKRVIDVANRHKQHIRIMKSFRACMKRNKKALNKAARKRDTRTADRLKNKCLSSRNQRRLRTNNSGGSSYKSLSVGLGADIAAFFGVGADAGFVWDINGNLPTRLFLGGSSGGGLRAGAGADVTVGINTDPNTSGVSKYYGGSVGADWGFGVGFGVILARQGQRFENSPLRGFEVSAGVGASVNAGSIDKIKTRIFRRSCRNVQVRVTNNGNKKIRILDLNYYDRGKKRSEPTPNRTVKPGKTRDVWKRPHDLGKVGYEQTQLEVVYRYKGEKRTKRLPAGICKDEDRFSVSLP
jgi:hypothetical protein